MIWDYATGQEFVRIEAVQDSEVIALIVEIPLECPGAEELAIDICNAHNLEQE